MDIFRAELGFVGIARLAFAVSLIGGVCGNGDIAKFGKALRVSPATCSLTPPFG